MNFLMQDFLMAVSNASYRQKILGKKKNLSKDELDSLNLIIPIEKESLRKELAAAEDLYVSLEGKISKRKLAALRLRIDSFKSKLDSKDTIVVNDSNVDDFIEHEGMVISPPMIEDLYNDINELDEHLSIPKDLSTQIVVDEKVDTSKSYSYVHLLNIPPPPEK
ncbi:MAG: hypothetical protein KJ583_04360 [Nanoarchaeota archaeon]|nr:hypothetical protein [Nanoarchaeota archaeon]MBU1270307.1 hypothetical protein [Nanoarchaeota archaeon]MBU1604525.1 hypothetical protein [Nanoarchaeota archaeon]MBU2442860.1 hypothetical protein [Nanoarchaeota archaeon]